MRINHLVMAHEDAPAFGRLVTILANREGARVFAHIDAKIDGRPFVEATDADVVHVRRRAVHWGGFSQVLAMMDLLRTAVEVDPADRYVFLSGRDYPARPLAEFEALLEAHPDREYMTFYAMVPGSEFFFIRRHYWSGDLFGRLPQSLKPTVEQLMGRINARLPERALPAGLPLYRGSTSWAVTHRTALTILQFAESRKGRALAAFCRSARVPDEIFFQTIVLNSDRAALIDTHRIVDGVQVGGRERWDDSGLHYIDWDPGRENPAVLHLGDLDAVRRSGKYFVRKVGSEISGPLVEALDSAAYEHDRARTA